MRIASWPAGQSGRRKPMFPKWSCSGIILSRWAVPRKTAMDELQTQNGRRAARTGWVLAFAIIVVERSVCECAAGRGIWLAGGLVLRTGFRTGRDSGLLADQPAGFNSHAPRRSTSSFEPASQALFAARAPAGSGRLA